MNDCPQEPDPELSERSLDLDGFREVPEEQGLSLERLSQAFARAMGQGKVPYEAEDLPSAEIAEQPSEDSPTAGTASQRAVDHACAISPQTIIEAILFVGHPENQPLTNRQIAALMRGVRPQEVDEIVRQLNELYEQQGAAYHIVSAGAGYRMQLRHQFARLRERFYGRIRQARLSQSAIDVLAIVAYNQPVDRQRVDQLRGRPSSAVLSQLVRRDLLVAEVAGDRPRRLIYRTTQRFLDLFELDSLEDLPRPHETNLLD